MRSVLKTRPSTSLAVTRAHARIDAYASGGLGGYIPPCSPCFIRSIRKECYNFRKRHQSRTNSGNIHVTFCVTFFCECNIACNILRECYACYRECYRECNTKKRMPAGIRFPCIQFAAASLAAISFLIASQMCFARALVGLLSPRRMRAICTVCKPVIRAMPVMLMP